MESSRERQLFLAWCANQQPGPLTATEHKFFSALLENCIADAEAGDALRQFDLGIKYLTGIFAPNDIDKAVYWLNKAAQQRDADALSSLAVLYFYGAGVPRSQKTAFVLMLDAARLGSFVAQFYVAWMYKHGIGTEARSRDSFTWYHTAADNPKIDGIVPALSASAGRDQGAHLPTPSNSEMKAIAYYEVAWAFHSGRGVAQNLSEAEKWYLAAAQNGHATSANELGMLYARGFPKREMAKAIQWWRKAADEGIGQAALNLAVAYARGDGIPTQTDQAKLWAQRAADSGIAEANLLLGNLEAETTPVRSGDLLRAIEYYRKVAFSGNVGAQHNIGITYQRLALINQQELDSTSKGSPNPPGSARYFWFDTDKMRMRLIADSPERIARFAEEFDSSQFPPLPEECIDISVLWLWLASENGSVEAKSSIANIEGMFDKTRLDILKRRYEKFRVDFDFEASQSRASESGTRKNC